MQKRLQIIRNIIEAQDFKELELEIEEFRKVVKEKEHLFILDYLDKKDYYAALVMINRILKSKTAVKQKSAEDLTGLKTLGKMLELELSVLANKKAELDKTINQFRLRHNQELGEVLSRILFIRKELMLRDYEDNPDKKEVYKEAQRDWEEYHSSQQKITGSLHRLSKEEKKEIQKLFRKASKRCHPDVMAEEYKELASSVFIELSQAYYHNDLEKLRELAMQLEDNTLQFVRKTESVSLKDQLKAAIQKLEGNILLLKEEILHIKNSDSYQTIAEINDMDIYFSNLKARLQKELEMLEKEFEHA